MQRESLVFFVGCILILTPFLGIPNLWKRGISAVLGLVLVLVGYQLRRAAYLRSILRGGERVTDVYVEQVELPASVASLRLAEPSAEPDPEPRLKRRGGYGPRRKTPEAVAGAERV